MISAVFKTLLEFALTISGSSRYHVYSYLKSLALGPEGMKTDFLKCFYDQVKGSLFCPMDGLTLP